MELVRFKSGAAKNFNIDPNDKFIMGRIEVAILVDATEGSKPTIGLRAQAHKRLLLFLTNLVTQVQMGVGFKFNPLPINIPVSFKTWNITRFIVSVEQNYHASANDKFLMEKYMGGDEIDLEEGETFDEKFPVVFDSLMLEMKQEVIDIQKEKGMSQGGVILPTSPEGEEL